MDRRSPDRLSGSDRVKRHIAFESRSFPVLKLSRNPRFFAATLAALPSISEIPLNSVASPLSRRYPRGFTFYVARSRALHSSIPAFLIEKSWLPQFLVPD